MAAVSRAPTHSLSKPSPESIRLLPGSGVEGDARLEVRPGDPIRVGLPPAPHRPLAPV